MASAQRFEDIKAWQKARELVKNIYQATSVGKFARDFVLRDQIRRAAVSIMSNIAEGFEREGNKEFLQFLSLAKGSCGEVRAQLYVAIRSGIHQSAAIHNAVQPDSRIEPRDVGPYEISPPIGNARKQVQPVGARSSFNFEL